MDIAAVILAGGFGTRVRHLLPDVPKPMAPIMGKPFLEWVVRFLAKQRIQRILISTGYLADVIAAHFTEHKIQGTEVRCFAETTPLGTAGGFLNSVANSGLHPHAWLVLNGDSLCFLDITSAAVPLQNESVDGVVAGCHVPDAGRYGTLVTNERGDLLGFQEKRPGAGIINAGIYLFADVVVRQFPDKVPLSFETEVFPFLARKKASLKVVLSEGPFLDIGTPETLVQATEFVRANKAQFS